MALNAKQQRFVEEYLCDPNATQAAIRAGYSEKTAYSSGQRLLNHVEVQAQIAELQGKRGERTQLTADRVLLELGRLGLSDVRKLFTESGQLRTVQSLDDDTAAAVASVEVVTRPGAAMDEDGNREIEYVHKIKLWDKNSALDKIAKHFGMFIERHEVTGKNGGPMTVELSSPRDRIAARLADMAQKAADGSEVAGG